MELLLPLLLFGLIMVPMFMMTNRQRKAQAELAKLQSQLQVGDEVRTHSGFYGVIVEEFEGFVILETESETRTKWSRAAIAGLAEPLAGGAVLGAEEEGLEDEDVTLDRRDDDLERENALPDFADGSDLRDPDAAPLAQREGDIPGVTAREDAPRDGFGRSL